MQKSHNFAKTLRSHYQKHYRPDSKWEFYALNIMIYKEFHRLIEKMGRFKNVEKSILSEDFNYPQTNIAKKTTKLS